MFKGQLVWCNSPPCFSSPLEDSLHLALAQLLIEMSVLGCCESCQYTLCFTNFEAVVCCDVGEWMDFYLSVLHGYFACVVYVYTIKIGLLSLGEFPLK